VGVVGCEEAVGWGGLCCGPCGTGTFFRFVDCCGVVGIVVDVVVIVCLQHTCIHVIIGSQLMIVRPRMAKIAFSETRDPIP